jgi:serine/threonine protein kinase
MGRLFTIAEGLENMGALRTGGQGSVYKGRRTGEIFTAVKILPTPIHTESIDDKNFRDFQNEVEKLKKVNEVPNPNVVKILNSGITESGSFPFIEMEFIEGPDLEELLKPPHDPVFSIREVIKVADQLASALAHCHKVGVRHGDIKSNNVKFNSQTGNYVLLDFGLAAMSDEQRRTSLRHAGAIEFMAPEQNEGLMLFQTDVYSYGIILYELIAGTVPFPLRDKGETTRNAVMVSHLETPVPDVLARRSEHLPDEWPDDRKKREMQVPVLVAFHPDNLPRKKARKPIQVGRGTARSNHTGQHTSRKKWGGARKQCYRAARREWAAAQPGASLPGAGHRK